MAKCAHILLVVKTEKDRCTWIKCWHCGVQGPKKHSVALALCAWIIYLSNDHPERRKPRERASATANHGHDTKRDIKNEMITPGWRKMLNARKAHWFDENGLALCKFWRFLGTAGPLDTRLTVSPDNCKQCAQALGIPCD